MIDTTTIYRGKATMEDRADAARQAGFYEGSQRQSDWERIARSEGKPGGYGFLWWCIAVVVIAVVAVWATQ